MAKKIQEPNETTNEKVEQKEIFTQEEKVKKENIKISEDKNEDSIFELNQKLISIEHLIQYYGFIANANVGDYPYDTQSIYKNAISKVKQLEAKKVAILNILEKKIL